MLIVEAGSSDAGTARWSASRPRLHRTRIAGLVDPTEPGRAPSKPWWESAPRLDHRFAIVPKLPAFYQRPSSPAAGRAVRADRARLRQGHHAPHRPGEEADQRARAAMEQVGSPTPWIARWAKCSGMRQRTRLAQAVAHDPEIVVADDLWLDPIAAQTWSCSEARERRQERDPSGHIRGRAADDGADPSRPTPGAGLRSRGRRLINKHASRVRKARDPVGSRPDSWTSRAAGTGADGRPARRDAGLGTFHRRFAAVAEADGRAELVTTTRASRPSSFWWAGDHDRHLELLHGTWLIYRMHEDGGETTARSRPRPARLGGHHRAAPTGPDEWSCSPSTSASSSRCSFSSNALRVARFGAVASEAEGAITYPVHRPIPRASLLSAAGWRA